MAKDYYKILEIDKSASKEDIKRAFRKLARKYHPDVNPDEPKSGEKFKEINEAYRILSDDKKREMFDKFGVVDGDPSTYQQYAEGGFPGSGSNVYQGPDGSTYYYSNAGGPGGFDFSEMFGNAGRSKKRKDSGGFDFFNDLGDIFDVFNKQGGSSRARSSGFSSVPREGEDLRYDMEIDFMDAFNGGESKVSYRDPVSGSVTSLKVKIPKGIKDQQKLRLKGKGMPGENGGQPGDLYINMIVRPHPIFTLVGDDIQVEQEISFTTAVLGGKIDVPGIERTITVNVPAGTKDGAFLRLKNLGFYKVGSEERGNELVKIRIKIPEKLNKTQKELLEKLQAVGI